MKYTVVEKAGYIGEKDQRSFDTYAAANDWMHEHYTRDELDPLDDDCLHVDIARDNGDERTYDF